MHTDNDAHIQIGRAAELTGLSVRTLRHYEEVGLIVPSARTTGGFRLYTDDDLTRLRVIRRMKPLDFTLEEMRQLLHALDLLAAPETATEHREDAANTLATFHQRAEEAVRHLRKQLAYAEELTDTLAARSRSH